jgi:hypothetical protein
MLTTIIIYPIDNVECSTAMLVYIKKQDPKMLNICVDFRGTTKVIITNPFSTPFADDIINDVVGYECYSFTEGLFGCDQVSIVKEGQ